MTYMCHNFLTCCKVMETYVGYCFRVMLLSWIFVVWILWIKVACANVLIVCHERKKWNKCKNARMLHTHFERRITKKGKKKKRYYKFHEPTRLSDKPCLSQKIHLPCTHAIKHDVYRVMTLNWFSSKKLRYKSLKNHSRRRKVECCLWMQASQQTMFWSKIPFTRENNKLLKCTF